MNPFTKLMPIVLTVTMLGCTSPEPEAPGARGMTPPPDALNHDDDTARTFAIPPAPDPRLNRRQLNELVQASPCDILPEYGSHVGTLAHGLGYPRWNGFEIQYDSANPEVARTPDPSVVHALTGGLTFENEVHDCQRLVVTEAESLVFGPLVGLFPLDISMHMPDAVFSVTPIPVATIYNWGDFNEQPERYARLGIESGWNCLWLYNAGHDQWRAGITSDVAAPCMYHSPPSALSLDVLRLHHRSATPRTARLGWHERAGVQLLGVKCGRAWCWIGPEDLWQDDRMLLTGDPHTTIPGWFDEQHLDVPSTGGSDPVVPGPYAMVTPTQEFHDAATLQHGSAADRITDFFRQRPVFAQIDIRGFTGQIPAPYVTKWGVRELPVRIRMSVPASGDKPWDNPRSTFLRPDDTAGRSVAPTRITGTAHAALGAVRWRWHDTDSTVSVWSPCGVKGMDCCDTR